MNVLVVIPARKGSVRCPNKNGREFYAGKNIVDLALKRAISLEPKAVVVTHDYDYNIGIKGYRESFNVPVYWEERPEFLCKSTIKSESVLFDALLWYASNIDELPEVYCLMQPTTPLALAKTVERAIKEYELSSVNAMISVNPAYQPNGCFYLGKTKAFLETSDLFPAGETSIYRMDWEESMDINYEHEFSIAQAIYGGEDYDEDMDMYFYKKREGAVKRADYL